MFDPTTGNMPELEFHFCCLPLPLPGAGQVFCSADSAFLLFLSSSHFVVFLVASGSCLSEKLFEFCDPKPFHLISNLFRLQNIFYEITWNPKQKGWGGQASFKTRNSAQSVPFLLSEIRVLSAGCFCKAERGNVLCASQ